MYDKLLQLIKCLQENGIPVLLFRDEKTKGPSVSMTLLLISFAIAALGLLGKFAKLVGDVDMDNAFELLIITGSLYFGRKLSKKFVASKEDTDNEK